jgi:hypothetical protein
MSPEGGENRFLVNVVMACETNTAMTWKTIISTSINV